MIARIWKGTVPLAKAEAYLDLMRRIALPDYTRVPGNRGAWCLSRNEGDVTHVQMLTFWDDIAAITRFAGADYERAKYYDFDPDYLITLESRVVHYHVDAG
jgi:hypothetical protein